MLFWFEPPNSKKKKKISIIQHEAEDALMSDGLSPPPPLQPPRDWKLQTAKRGETKWQLIAVSCLSFRGESIQAVWVRTLTPPLLPRDWWVRGHLA